MSEHSLPRQPIRAHNDMPNGNRQRSSGPAKYYKPRTQMSKAEAKECLLRTPPRPKDRFSLLMSLGPHEREQERHAPRLAGACTTGDNLRKILVTPEMENSFKLPTLEERRSRCLFKAPKPHKPNTELFEELALDVGFEDDTESEGATISALIEIPTTRRGSELGYKRRQTILLAKPNTAPAASKAILPLALSEYVRALYCMYGLAVSSNITSILQNYGLVYTPKAIRTLLACLNETTKQSVSLVLLSNMCPLQPKLAADAIFYETGLERFVPALQVVQVPGPNTVQLITLAVRNMITVLREKREEVAERVMLALLALDKWLKERIAGQDGELPEWLVTLVMVCFQAAPPPIRSDLVTTLAPRLAADESRLRPLKQWVQELYTDK